MRAIALMNQKGGVGKTTTCVNLGAALAERGHNICMIDMDPQAHLTINFGVNPEELEHTLYDLMLEDDVTFLQTCRKLPESTQRGTIAVVPGSIDLAAAETEMANRPNRQLRLKQKLDAAEHDFDFCLLDCPPSLGLLTLNALALADEVLIPMQPHFLALQGFAKLLETVRMVNEQINPRLKVLGVVLTMFDSQTRLSSEVVAELEQFMTSARGRGLPWSDATVFKSRIRRNIKLAECPSFGESILRYDGGSNGAADYRAVAAELDGGTPVEASPPALRASVFSTGPLKATRFSEVPLSVED